MGADSKYLVVEDDDTVARTVARYFRRTGVVSIARTVADARNRLERDRLWSGLILDVGLPDGSGLSVLEHVRAMGRETPVLVLTASREEDVLRAAALHRAFYVPKPFMYGELEAFARAAQTAHDASDALEHVVGMLAATHELSPRESEITMLASAGMSRSTIARELGISVATLNTYVRRAVSKSDRASWDALIDEIHCAVFHRARDRRLREC